MFLIFSLFTTSLLCIKDNGDEFFGGAGDAEHWESVRTSLHRLANDSSKKLSKTAKKEQHATFRRFLSSLDEFTAEGVSELDSKSTPNAIVSFIGGKVTCESWLEYGKLSQLRRCLSGGLPDHLCQGEVAALIMSDSLQLEHVSDQNIEHGKRSAGGKVKMSQRGKERSNKEHEKNSFFEQDE